MAWIEQRGLVLRADGEALVVTRGAATVMPIPAAIDALSSLGLALWLAGVSWRPPKGCPWLRRLRLLVDGAGDWGEARAEFLRIWWAAESGRIQRRF